MVRVSLRGEPVMALLLVLAGWTVFRIWSWHSPPVDSTVAELPEKAALTPLTVESRLTDQGAPVLPDNLKEPALAARSFAMATRTAGLPAMGMERVAGSNFPVLSAFSDSGGDPGFADAPVLSAPSQPVPSVPHESPRREKRRWSMDAWLLLREDTTTPVTSGRGNYGQSQLGAVLRYSPLPGSRFRPAVYMRASKALVQNRESEFAGGVMARPLPDVAISVAAEVRLSDAEMDRTLRPAAFAVTELPPVALAYDFKAEAYAQVGYVGGDYATAFADGQFRLHREVLRLGAIRASLGGGVWGGAQKGAERVDMGPGVTLAVPLQVSEHLHAGVRLSADWRFRVAGDANPSSGPSLTLSTGF